MGAMPQQEIACGLGCTYANIGFPGGSEVKAPACNVGDLGSIPGLGRFPGEGNGNPLQYSCLENSMDIEARQATVHGITKSWTQLCDFIYSVNYKNRFFMHIYFNIL